MHSLTAFQDISSLSTWKIWKGQKKYTEEAKDKAEEPLGLTKFLSALLRCVAHLAARTLMVDTVWQYAERTFCMADGWNTEVRKGRGLKQYLAMGGFLVLASQCLLEMSATVFRRKLVFAFAGLGRLQEDRRRLGRRQITWISCFETRKPQEFKCQICGLGLSFNCTFWLPVQQTDTVLELVHMAWQGVACWILWLLCLRTKDLMNWWAMMQDMMSMMSCELVPRPASPVLSSPCFHWHSHRQEVLQTEGCSGQEEPSPAFKLRSLQPMRKLNCRCTVASVA